MDFLKTRKKMERLLRDWKKVWKGLLAVIFVFVLLKICFGKICPGKIFTGFPCPACGTTRAFILLCKGKVLESINMQPMLLPLGVLCLWYLIEEYIVEKQLRNWKKYVIFALVFSFGTYFVRMYLLFPNIEPMEYYKNNLIEHLLVWVRQ